MFTQQVRRCHEGIADGLDVLETPRLRDDLGLLVDELQDAVDKFEIAKQRREERLRQMAEKKAAKNLLVSSSA